VVNPESPPLERFVDRVWHVGQGLTPGAFTSGQRIYRGVTDQRSRSGRVYNTGDEVTSVVTGQRRMSFDLRQSMGFRLPEYGRRIKDAERILGDVLTDRSGSIDEAQVRNSYIKADQRRRAVWDTLHEDIWAARRLGMDDREIRAYMKNASFSDDLVKSLMRGEYRPYKVPKGNFTRMRKQSRLRTRGDEEERMREVERLQRNRRVTRETYGDLRQESRR